MKVYLSRLLMLATFVFLIIQMTAQAQKNKKMEENIASNSGKQTPSPNAPAALSPLEAAVVAEINQARTDPQKIVGYLEEYRKYMKGTTLSMPNKPSLQMIEGSPAIDDAINALKKMSKINSYEVSAGLSKVARRQLADLQENPKLKHLGKDGSDLEMRLLKVGFPGDAIAENISYQAATAREIVLNMIIDDGIKSRSHRKNIFSQTFKVFGIACGSAQDKTTLCVAEFSNAFKER